MKKLFRSTADSKLTGLCGGIGEWLSVDANIIRMLVVVLSLFSFGTVVLAYFLVSLFVPKAPYGDMTSAGHYHY